MIAVPVFRSTGAASFQKVKTLSGNIDLKEAQGFLIRVRLPAGVGLLLGHRHRRHAGCALFCGNRQSRSTKTDKTAFAINKTLLKSSRKTSCPQY